MLTHMSDEDRFNLTGKLCQEVCSKQLLDLQIVKIPKLGDLQWDPDFFF